MMTSAAASRAKVAALGATRKKPNKATRVERKIGLREMAKIIGVSPTYLSKVERDEFPPPAEAKVRSIAGIIGCEYASIFSTAGTRVTLVDRRDEILASVDREIVEHLQGWFRQQKMEID